MKKLAISSPIFVSESISTKLLLAERKCVVKILHGLQQASMTQDLDQYLYSTVQGNLIKEDDSIGESN
jgi:hypothetical protein